MDPSLSSASIINHSPRPTLAFPILPSLIMLISPAPLIILGCIFAVFIISNNMALVVLFPDVPPTAIVFLLSAIKASKSLLLIIGIFNESAFCTSGTVSSIAVETMTSFVCSVIPNPFWEKHFMPSFSNLFLVSLYSPSIK